MQKGNLIQIMRGDAHPQVTIRKASEIIAAAALGVSNSPEEAMNKLERAGAISHPELSLQSLRGLRNHLDQQPQNGLVNAYLHVTYTCNLSCLHCYAKSTPENSMAMKVGDVISLVNQAAQAGFHKIAITGGEPIAHPERYQLLDGLWNVRNKSHHSDIVLRTNLAYSISDSLLDKIAHSTDQVVVSVDGNQTSHDHRRGAGTYARTVENLRRLVFSKPSTKVSIAAVLPADQINGAEGDAVRTLGKELGIGIRFKPLLPISLYRMTNLLSGL